MRFSTVAVAVLATLVSSTAAKSWFGIPDCAIQCFAHMERPNCGLDIGCYCKTPGFIDNARKCFPTKCGDADVKKMDGIIAKHCH
ncbi:hypothetical protein FRB99_003320 [Tulasnella sp. 403]|nr:hypothetical protein FRB99_003320 [Tulasnella sp. 403]